MSTQDPVEQARQALVTKFGSLWNAASQMRLDCSGGQLLTGMRKTPVPAVIACLVEQHTGINLNQPKE